MSETELRSTGDAFAFTRREPVRVRERELLRVAAALSGTDHVAAARAARSEVLSWAAKQVSDQLPVAAAEGQSFEYLRGGRTCLGASFEDGRRALWALRVDRPDANVAQRTWTTEIVTGYAPASGPALFSLRLLVSTPEAFLPIEPSVPGLVRQVATACGLQHGDARIDGLPWFITSQADAEDLVGELTSPSRSMPYLVCSIAEEESAPRLDVRLLAKAALGIARVVVVPSAHTWVLTEQLGKPRSVYNGAVRAYMPGFSQDANPYVHRLFFVEPVADDGRARSTLTALRWLVANESLRRLRLGDDVVAFSEVRESSLDFERQRLKQAGSSETEQLKAAQIQVDALKDDLERSKAETEQWLSEYERADEEAQNYQQQLRGAQFRIQQLLAQIKERGDEPDSAVQFPESWDTFADWCDEVFSGRVMLSSRARRETKSADFDDPQTAARCLLWLSNEYRDSRMNGATGDLRKPISDGIHNERCGADSFEFPWNGRQVPVEWHIKNGGNTRDPRRCLRIYYFWDEESQVVVIATMPGHVRTGAT